MEINTTGQESLVAQFGRFVVIGLMNTAINFAVLNLLSFAFGITKGEKIIWIAVIAFTIATTNSFYWNKRWTFHDTTVDHGQEFTLFLIVSIVGAAINSAVVYTITSHVHPMFGFSDRLWLNIANAFATGISLIWNFIGYKFFVFKK
jgi:putative flippase GtrA